MEIYQSSVMVYSNNLKENLMEIIDKALSDRIDLDKRGYGKSANADFYKDALLDIKDVMDKAWIDYISGGSRHAY